MIFGCIRTEHKNNTLCLKYRSGTNDLLCMKYHCAGGGGGVNEVALICQVFWFMVGVGGELTFLAP